MLATHLREALQGLHCGPAYVGTVHQKENTHEH
jgi:hypothetical protein